jgi:uncharacterized membrane protein
VRLIAISFFVATLTSVVLIMSACNYRIAKSERTSNQPNDKLATLAQLDYNVVAEYVFKPSCTGCHGQVAGVNLETYDSVFRKLSLVEEQALKRRTMPPQGGLTACQSELLQAWIAEGAPKIASQPAPVLTACGGSILNPARPPTSSPALPTVPVEATYASIDQNIIQPKCLSCHSSGGVAGRVPLGTLSDLLTSPLEIVIPGSPDESGLIIMVARTDAKRMPPPTVGPSLSLAEVNAVRAWIEQGAKP